MSDQTIERFTHIYNSANDLIRKGQFEKAAYKYREMLTLYEDINNSSRESVHKEIAHSCLEKVYNQLQQTEPEDGMSTAVISLLIVTTIIVFGLGVVLLLDPSIVGLVSFMGDCSWYGPTEFEVDRAIPQQFDAQKYSSCFLKGVLVAKTQNVNAEIDGTAVTLHAANTGYEEITLLLVSRSNEVTRVPLSITMTRT